jgi:hypothetical protein
MLEMSAGGRRPDNVKNVEVARQSAVAALGGEASGEDE